MTLIKLEDLKQWRAKRIQDGRCSFDDMQALGHFIDQVEKIERITCGECIYGKIREVDGMKQVYCDYQFDWWYIDGYCSYGEKR